MADETNTPSPEGIDNVKPSETDTPEEWDYFDPEEDQDTEESPDDDGTDDEAAEADEAEEAEPEEAEEPAETEDAVFTLSDGTKLSRAEVESGFLRQADYTRKTQELKTQKNSVNEIAQRIEGITEAFIEHLASLVPDEPSYALAVTDPQKYTRQKAQYDAAMMQVQKLIEMGQQPKQLREQMSADDRKEYLQSENQRLISAVPEAAKDRKKFFEGVQNVAEKIGFTTDELNQVADHRVFVLAHWAAKGMEAEKARASAKAKAQKAPPVAPRKPGQAAKGANNNAAAMQKLRRSGSIHDALAVDFD